MIGNVYSGSSSVVVVGSTNSTYVNGYSGAQGVGNMRYNTSTQKTEVFDGSSWVTLNMGSVSVSLSSETEALLEWARKKRDEEFELEHLAETNPTIKDLVNKVNLYKDQIKMVQTLLKSPGNEPESSQEPMRP